MAKEYFEIVDGYVFRSRKAAEQARKELEGIRFVKKQMDTKNPETVLSVYNQILQEKLFHTVVGYNFLRQLQEYLKGCPEIDDEYIRALDIDGGCVQGENKAASGQEEKMKQQLSVSFIANVILGVLVLAMILLMRFSDNATILNYENKIIDRYEHWEKELEEREEAVKEKEKELGIRP